VAKISATRRVGDSRRLFGESPASRQRNDNKRKPACLFPGLRLQREESSAQDQETSSPLSAMKRFQAWKYELRPNGLQKRLMRRFAGAAGWSSTRRWPCKRSNGSTRKRSQAMWDCANCSRHGVMPRKPSGLQKPRCLPSNRRSRIWNGLGQTTLQGGQSHRASKNGGEATASATRMANRSIWMNPIAGFSCLN